MVVWKELHILWEVDSFLQIIKSVIFHPSPDLPDASTWQRSSVSCFFFFKLFIPNRRRLCHSWWSCEVLGFFLTDGSLLAEVSDFHRPQESLTPCSGLLLSSRSSIDSEPALVLGPLKSVQELRREQQLAEIESRRQERERSGEEASSEGRTKPPVQEMVDELQGPFSYDFSYWAR